MVTANAPSPSHLLLLALLLSPVALLQAVAAGLASPPSYLSRSSDANAVQQQSLSKAPTQAETAPVVRVSLQEAPFRARARLQAGGVPARVLVRDREGRDGAVALSPRALEKRRSSDDLDERSDAGWAVRELDGPKRPAQLVWDQGEGTTAKGKRTTAMANQGVELGKEKLSLALGGSAYRVSLTVGSSEAPQALPVQLDTGSSDLWIVSSQCTDQECTGKIADGQPLPIYDLGKSSSYAPLLHGAVNASSAAVSSSLLAAPAASTAATVASTVPFQTSFGDGTVASGVVGSDDVTLGGLSVPGQVFGLVNTTNVSLTSQSITGVLGLGFERLSQVSRSLASNATGPYTPANASTPPLLVSLASSGQLAYPLFSLSLPRDQPSNSSLTLGALDPHLVPTSADRALVEWHDVVPFPFAAGELHTGGIYTEWAIQVADMGVNGTSTGVGLGQRSNASSSSGGPEETLATLTKSAVLDSGTEGIYGPLADVAALFETVPDARLVYSSPNLATWAMPCNTQMNMYLRFGSSAVDAGRPFILRPEDYLIGVAAGGSNMCLAWPMAQPASNDGVGYLLGTPFLRSVYSIYSFGIEGLESPKVGLFPVNAPANLSELVPPSPSGTAAATSPSTVNATAALLFNLRPAASETSLLSTLTTLNTNLPGLLLPTPTFSTASFVFANATSFPAPGALATTALGVLPSSSLVAATPTAAAPSGGSASQVATGALIGTKVTGVTALPVLDATVIASAFPTQWEGAGAHHSAAAPRPRPVRSPVVAVAVSVALTVALATVAGV